MVKGGRGGYHLLKNARKGPFWAFFKLASTFQPQVEIAVNFSLSVCVRAWGKALDAPETCPNVSVPGTFSNLFCFPPQGSNGNSSVGEKEAIVNVNA